MINNRTTNAPMECSARRRKSNFYTVGDLVSFFFLVGCRYKVFVMDVSEIMARLKDGDCLNYVFTMLMFYSCY